MEGDFILVRDNDGHWYVIPDSKSSEWRYAVLAAESGNGELPAWATQVGGHPSLVKFSGWHID